MTTRTMMMAVLALGALPATAGAQQAEMEAGASASVRASAPTAREASPERDQVPRGRVSSGAHVVTRAHLEASREALEDGERRGASRGEVEAGARALAAGAERSDVERVRDEGGQRDLTASLDALAEMTASGMASSRAAATVSAHLARGASDEAIGRLGAAASATSALGSSAAGGAGAAASLGAAGSLGGSLGTALGAGASAGARIGGIIRF